MRLCLRSSALMLVNHVGALPSLTQSSLPCSCSATLWTAGNISIALVSPLIGAMSDAFGRVPILLQGRIGLILWFWGTAASTKLWHFMLADWLSWGWISAAVMSVEDAWFADRLGERPQLSGQIRAKNGVWGGIAGFASPFLGIWLAQKSRSLAFNIGALACAMQCAAVLWHGETLPKPSRKPLTWGAARRPAQLATSQFVSVSISFCLACCDGQRESIPSIASCCSSILVRDFGALPVVLLATQAARRRGALKKPFNLGR
eukprot:SAG31_NODE_2179_length_6249_cov_15.633984_4_plen_261_part_00